MMSPLTVAQHLKPGVLQFDLVVMDEASQLRPAEAVGTLLRGKQVVIVGDPKQLPPTAFFTDSMGGNDSDDDGDNAQPADVVTEQSILEQALSTFPMRRLTWHYRSRHPSLIAYSNRAFYDSELVIFPSAVSDREDRGVRFEAVPGVYAAGRNEIEAEHVAAAVLLHARRFPQRSLGVATMNAAQCELVKEKIDALARENPDLEAWRIQSDNSLEPFFVKNLENVQGDERDAIFISTVYGRDAKGSMFQRFGPINQADGHRRLNVLITRAKFLVRVFSSMSHNDIVVDEKSSRGVQTLRGFLQFAADGTLDAPVATGREPDSEFERSVLSVLTNAGYQVVPQVGVAGYFIDIGVRNPFRPGEFILGVECDGARYHSSRSARDRDRLRQDVLEQRDWRIHRIWSLDWFESKSRESERLLASVRRAIEAAQSDASPRERVPDGS